MISGEILKNVITKSKIELKLNKIKEAIDDKSKIEAETKIKARIKNK